MSKLLQDIIKTCRKRSGLSQDEMAHLIGKKSGAYISQLENRKVFITTKILIAYLIIFRETTEKLLPAIYDEIRQSIITNRESLKTLNQKLTVRRRLKVKKEFLKTLDLRLTNNIENDSSTTRRHPKDPVA